MEKRGVHNDPDWENYTYGDWSGGSKAGLKNLEKKDVLIFTCGLEGWDFTSPPGIYLAGYFIVEVAGTTLDFNQKKLKSMFSKNAHVWRKTHKELVDIYDGKLILVKGTSQSCLLKKAVLLSTTAQDSMGRPLKVLSRKMQRIFGSFGGKIAIQRSPTRWILDSKYTKRTMEFLQSLD
jgi:hypothetical protein